jgi:hypothetical protein
VEVTNMPRIRFVEKGDIGFLILATRGPGSEYADGTIVVSQPLLNAVKEIFEREGVKYEVVGNSAAPLPWEKAVTP